MMGLTIFWADPREGRDDVVRLLSQVADDIRYGNDNADYHDRIEEHLLRQAVADVDAVLVGSREQITRGVIEAAPRLRVIAKNGIGVNNIDIEAATEHGVVVANTPIEENSRAVAEATVARILALANQLGRMERELRQGRWWRGGNLYIAGRTLGVVGFGRIGRTVCELMAPFCMHMTAHDPYVSSDEIAAHGVEPVDELSVLLSRADVITLHAAMAFGSEPLIGAHELAGMKPGAVLVNTARGMLIDEPALAHALSRGQIRGAALDVFTTEPLPLDSPLRSPELIDRLLLTPHSAGGTPEVSERMPLVMAANCVQALSGTFPEYSVNPQVREQWMARWNSPSPPAMTPGHD